MQPCLPGKGQRSHGFASNRTSESEKEGERHGGDRGGLSWDTATLHHASPVSSCSNRPLAHVGSETLLSTLSFKERVVKCTGWRDLVQKILLGAHVEPRFFSVEYLCCLQHGGSSQGCTDRSSSSLLSTFNGSMLNNLVYIHIYRTSQIVTLGITIRGSVSIMVPQNNKVEVHSCSLQQQALGLR